MFIVKKRLPEKKKQVVRIRGERLIDIHRGKLYINMRLTSTCFLLRIDENIKYYKMEWDVIILWL